MCVDMSQISKRKGTILIQNTHPPHDEHKIRMDQNVAGKDQLWSLDGAK